MTTSRTEVVAPSVTSAGAWRGEPETPGRAVVVGAGKIGLPLAAQYASRGWDVVAADVDERVVAAINAGRSHVGEEAGLADMVAEAHAAGRLRATTDTAGAVADADVVVVIVPVTLSDDRPDYRFIDAATSAVGRGLRGSRTPASGGRFQPGPPGSAWRRGRSRAMRRRIQAPRAGRTRQVPLRFIVSTVTEAHDTRKVLLRPGAHDEPYARMPPRGCDPGFGASQNISGQRGRAAGRGGRRDRYRRP